MTAYDFSALTRKITWAEVTEFRPTVWRECITGVIGLFACLLYGAWWMFGPRLTLPEAWWFLSDLGGILSGLLAMIAIVVAIVSVIVILGPFDERRALRIQLFAGENGFAYRRFGHTPPQVGVLFGRDAGVRVTDQLIDLSAREVRSRTGTASVTVSLGNAALSTKPAADTSSTRTTGNVGYLHVALSVPSTHYLLDGKANNRFGGGSVAWSLQTSQKLLLEGDFNKYFTLYCPSGRERDALQIFTPDVMALLIDHGAAWDVEIVEDNLFVYSSRTLSPERPRDIQRLLQFADLVVPKLGGRIERARPGAVMTAEGRSLGGLLPRKPALVVWPLVVLLAIPIFNIGLGWLLDTV
ncbi:MAG: hypothetical protein ACOH19_04720 [Rhodoglobus sp.]